MDTSHWEPAQAVPPSMDAADWRSQLRPDSRQRIVNKILETLKRHLPYSGQEGLLELKRIAVKFEDNIYTVATSQSDYLRKISLKMLTMETKSQSPITNTFPSNSPGYSENPLDPGEIAEQTITLNNETKACPHSSDPPSHTSIDTSNWGPAQAEPPSMDASNWRSQLQPDSRQRIVNKILETLKRHLPFSGQKGLHELEKIAVKFEDKIYTVATSQSDYLRKISLKMLTMETKSQSPITNTFPSNSPGYSENPSDPGEIEEQTITHNNETTACPHSSDPPSHTSIDTSNWGPAQAEPPSMDVGDWRSQLQPNSRQRIVNKIHETLKKHLPFSGQEGLHELKKIAVEFEDKIYTAATSQSDYLRKISLKILTMETKSQSPTANPFPSNSPGYSKNPSDPELGFVEEMASERKDNNDTHLDAGDWGSQLQPGTRQRIVNKIMDTLKKHLPFSDQEGLHKLKKIAVRFEEKIYTAATSQSDYLRKISLKMLTMETKSQIPVANPLSSNSAGNGENFSDPAFHGIEPQLHDEGQSFPTPLAANKSHARQQLLSQGIHNNFASPGVQSYARLPPALPPVTSLTETPMLNVNQNSNIENVSGVSQNLVGNSMGQWLPYNMLANSQKQMEGRQLVVPQQQQQQSQNQQQYLYQQQIQQLLLMQKFQQCNIPHSLTQSHMQQQQQNLLQSTQLQSSQKSVMQASTAMQRSLIQSAPLSGLQQGQQSSIQQKFRQCNIPHSLMQSHMQQQQQQQQNLLQSTQLQSSQQSVMQASSAMQPSLIRSAPLSDLHQGQQSSVQQSTQYMLQQYLFQQQSQQQLLKQLFQQGNIPYLLMQSLIQQQQLQQNILQIAQLQSSQQSVMQKSSAIQPLVIQSTPFSGLQQSQQSSVQQSTHSMLQQHSQSLPRLPQQPQQSPVLPMWQQPNATNTQEKQVIGQQNSIPYMMQQQQQSLLCKQNNLPNLLHKGQCSPPLMDHFNRFLLVSLFLMFVLLIFLYAPGDFYSFIESLGV